MEDNFDKYIFYYCKVRCLFPFFIQCWATWVHEKQAQKLYPKGPSIIVSIDQFEFRLQAEGVVGTDKACHFASSCHSYDMFCLWRNWFSTLSVMKRYRSIIMDRIKALIKGTVKVTKIIYSIFNSISNSNSYLVHVLFCIGLKYTFSFKSNWMLIWILKYRAYMFVMYAVLLHVLGL